MRGRYIHTETQTNSQINARQTDAKTARHTQRIKQTGRKGAYRQIHTDTEKYTYRDVQTHIQTYKQPDTHT